MNEIKPRVRVPARSEYVPRVADTSSRPRTASLYMRGENSPFFWSWRPALREASTDVALAYTAAAARAIDAIHNSGWIAGAVDQSIAREIGTGLRLSAKPDADALKWTQDEAQTWAHAVERRFEAWASRPIDCDLEGKASLGKLAAQALRTMFAYGEICSSLPFVKRDGGQYGTKVNVIAPHRLVQTTQYPRIRDGVIVDPETGYPVGYRVSTAWDAMQEYRERDIPARDPYGRPQFVHVFDGFPGQYRGLPPIAPALRVVKQFEQLADATLTQALIQAIFAATVKSPAPTDQVLQGFQDLAEQQSTAEAQVSPFEAMLTSYAGWYEGTQIDIGSHGKIAHLAPGDELTFVRSETPNQQYEQFTRFLLREIARCLGLTFEELTGDYTGATYSSVRMATSVTWAIVLYRRANIIAPWYNQIYEAWLEEDIEAGWTPFPGGIPAFLANRAAACRAHWRGPAKPQADDLKWANAVDKLYRLGATTLEAICGEMGEDADDIMEQLAREKAARERLGLPDPLAVPAKTQPPSQADEPARQAEDA